MSLAVCSSCLRHVRESTCPFCGAHVAHATTVTLPRAARIALVGAAAVSAAVACSSTTSPQPLYGAAMPDSSIDAHEDAIATFYGGVPIDATPPEDATTDATTTDATTDADDAGED